MKNKIEQSKNLSLVLEMSKIGLTNKQMALSLKVKPTTICKYKRMLKDNGFCVNGKSGRPLSKNYTHI